MSTVYLSSDDTVGENSNVKALDITFEDDLFKEFQPEKTSSTKKDKKGVKTQHTRQSKRNRSNTSLSPNTQPVIKKVNNVVKEAKTIMSEPAPEKQVIVLISPEGFPSCVLTENHFEAITDFVREARNSFKCDDGPALAKIKIDDIDLEEEGLITVKCGDMFTAKWIFDLKIKIKDVPKLKVMIDDDEASKMGRCTILVKKRLAPYKHSEFMRQLVEGNPGFKVKTLILRDRKYLEKDPKHMVLAFSLDQDAIEWLKGRGGQVRFDIKKTRIFYPGMRSSQNESKKPKLEI